MSQSLIEAARPGDRVTITTPQGQKRTGRVVMNERTHLVLNLGGRHGTPGVATARNIVSLRYMPSQRSYL